MSELLGPSHGEIRKKIDYFELENIWGAPQSPGPYEKHYLRLIKETNEKEFLMGGSAVILGCPTQGSLDEWARIILANYPLMTLSIVDNQDESLKKLKPNKQMLLIKGDVTNNLQELFPEKDVTAIFSNLLFATSIVSTKFDLSKINRTLEGAHSILKQGGSTFIVEPSVDFTQYAEELKVETLKQESSSGYYDDLAIGVAEQLLKNVGFRHTKACMAVSETRREYNRRHSIKIPGLRSRVRSRRRFDNNYSVWDRYSLHETYDRKIEGVAIVGTK